ncbi:MAG: hypothetical protein SFY81_15360 [Verrucomicrobiota bacterium]|nr:hypothetical protein [Verrucomicrobiota bacterium]
MAMVTCGVAADNARIAEVARLHGTPVVSKSEGNWQRLKAGDKISPGTRVKTGNSDTVDLYLEPSRRIVGLAPDSILRVEEKNLVLEKGQLLGSIRRSSFAANFQVQDTIINVNGADFLLDAQGNEITLLSGKAEIINSELPSPRVIKAGESQPLISSSTASEKISTLQNDRLLSRIDLLVSSRSSVSELFQPASPATYTPSSVPHVSPEPDPNKPSITLLWNRGGLLESEEENNSSTNPRNNNGNQPQPPAPPQGTPPPTAPSRDGTRK